MRREDILSHKMENERWGTNKDSTNATYESRDAQRWTAQKNRLWMVSRSVGKLVARWEWGVESRGALKLVLFARNLALNSDPAPNYNYMLGPHRGPMSHDWKVFVVRIKTRFILCYSKWAQWSDCANAQAELNLRWEHLSKGTFSDVAAHASCICMHVCALLQ